MYLRAFESRNFRLFFAGQSFALITGWMKQAAIAWLIYRLTDSAALLAMTVFLTQAPVLVITPFLNGILARVSGHKLLFMLKLASVLQALTLAALAYTDTAQAWSILALCMVSGLITGIEAPFKQAMVAHMVDDPAALSNAVVLNSININIARLIGPLIGGFVIAYCGEAACFLVNALANAAGVYSVTRMRLPDAMSKKQKAKGSLKAAAQHVWKKPRLRTAILLMAVTSAAFTPYYTVLAVYARDILQGDAKTLGVLMSWVGVGTLSATVLLLLAEKRINLSLATLASTALTGLSVMFFSINHDMAAAYALCISIGFFTIFTSTGLTVLLQTRSVPAMRSSVMQLFTMVNVGIIPFGGLLLGGLGSLISTPYALCLFTFVGLAAVLAITVRYPPVRRRMRQAF
jgi:predicted MFS family arabinose efflux permease